MKRLVKRALKQMASYPRKAILSTRSSDSNSISPTGLIINLDQPMQILRTKLMGHSSNLKMQWAQ